MTYRIFISSVQREFAKEWRALAEYIRKDMLLSCFRVLPVLGDIVSILEDEK